MRGGLVDVSHCTELNSRRAKLNLESVVNAPQTDARVFLMGGMLGQNGTKVLDLKEPKKKPAVVLINLPHSVETLLCLVPKRAVFRI